MVMMVVFSDTSQLILSLFSNALNVDSVPLIFQFLFVMPMALVGVRRLHDVSYAGYWIIFLFFPLLNIIIWLFMAFTPGVAGSNKYGPPRPTAEWEKVAGYIMIGFFGFVVILSIVGIIIARLG